MAKTTIGLRQFYYQFPDGGDEALVVHILRDGREVGALHGWEIAPLRVWLQKIEAEHPGLCGDAAAAEAVEKTDVFHTVVDPLKATEN